MQLHASRDLCPLVLGGYLCQPSPLVCRNVNSRQGLGVFATQAIRAHEMVLECVGEVVDLNEAKRRSSEYNQQNIMVSERGA